MNFCHQLENSENIKNFYCGSFVYRHAYHVDFVLLIKFLWLVCEYKINHFSKKKKLFMIFQILSDSPEDYWCKIPELENLTITQRKFLAIPLIDVSNFCYAHKEVGAYLK